MRDHGSRAPNGLWRSAPAERPCSTVYRFDDELANTWTGMLLGKSPASWLAM